MSLILRTENERKPDVLAVDSAVSDRRKPLAVTYARRICNLPHTTRVIRARERPDNYRAAYDEMKALHERLGLPTDDLAQAEIHPVETDQVPGFDLAVTHVIDGNHPSR